MAETSLRAYLQDIDDLVNHGQYEEAVAHCRQILTSYPKSLDTLRLLGKAYLELGRHGDAADIMERVLSAVPDDFVSHVGLGIIREDEGNLDAALFHMERAFEVQPTNSVIQDEMRRLYGRRDGLEPPRIRLTRGALARMYISGELYPQAVAELRACLAENPDRPDLQALLADVYWRAEQQVEAAEACSELLNRLPYCRTANRIMAQLWHSRGQDQEAHFFRSRLEALDPYEAYTNGKMVTEVNPSSVRVEKLLYDPSKAAASRAGGRPSWAESAGVKFEETPTSPAGPASVPDWLQRPTPPPGETVPDWVQSSLPAETHEEEQAPEVTAPAEPAQEIPEWLTKEAQAELSPAEQIQEEVGPGPTEGLPEWLRSGQWGAPSRAGEAPASPQENLPDWLFTPPAEGPRESLEELERRYEEYEEQLEGSPDLSTTGTGETAFVEPAEPAPPVPEFLVEPVSPEEAGTGLAWLETLAPEVSSSEGVRPAKPSLPEWLVGIAAAGVEAVQPEEAPAPEPEGLATMEAAPVEETPEGPRLEAAEAEPLVPEPSPLPEEDALPDWVAQIAAGAEPELAEAAAPSWMAGLEGAITPAEEVAQAGEAPEWLAGLAEAPESAAAFESPPAPEVEAPPAWRAELEAEAEPAEETAQLEEAPEWLAELAQAQESEADPGLRPALEVEAPPSWMAGLEGPSTPAEEVAQAGEAPERVAEDAGRAELQTDIDEPAATVEPEGAASEGVEISRISEAESDLTWLEALADSDSPTASAGWEGQAEETATDFEWLRQLAEGEPAAEFEEAPAEPAAPEPEGDVEPRAEDSEAESPAGMMAESMMEAPAILAQEAPDIQAQAEPEAEMPTALPAWTSETQTPEAEAQPSEPEVKPPSAMEEWVTEPQALIATPESGFFPEEGIAETPAGLPEGMVEPPSGTRQSAPEIEASAEPGAETTGVLPNRMFEAPSLEAEAQGFEPEGKLHAASPVGAIEPTDTGESAEADALVEESLAESLGEPPEQTAGPGAAPTETSPKEPAVEPQAEEPPALPGWMFETPAMAAEAETGEEEAVGPESKMEPSAPEWMMQPPGTGASLEEEIPAEGGFVELPSDLPEWMAEPPAAAWDETPEIREPVESGHEGPSDASVVSAEAEPSPQTLESPVIAEAAEADLSWLEALTTDESLPAPIAEPSHGHGTTELPDWIARMAAAAPIEETAPAAQVEEEAPVPSPSEEEAFPTWLLEAGSTAALRAPEPSRRTGSGPESESPPPPATKPTNLSATASLAEDEAQPPRPKERPDPEEAQGPFQQSAEGLSWLDALNQSSGERARGEAPASESPGPDPGWAPENVLAHLKDRLKAGNLTAVMEDYQQLILARARSRMAAADVGGALKDYALLIKAKSLLEETISDLKKSTQQFSMEGGLWRSLGDAYMRNEQSELALQAYKEALERS